MVVKESNTAQKGETQMLENILIIVSILAAVVIVPAVIRHEVKAIRNAPMKPLY